MVAQAGAASPVPDQARPFAYPAGLLDAPATLTQPVGDFARLGKPKVQLEVTPLEAVSVITGAPRLREGKNVFSRDILCVHGTENERPMIAWFISSDNKNVTEVQMNWVDKDKIPGFCRPLPKKLMPVRLGKIGLGMTRAEALEALGKPSRTDNAGWSYWFSQRFLRNQRGLQELELNWLALRFDKNDRIERAFISQVTNL